MIAKPAAYHQLPIQRPKRGALDKPKTAAQIVGWLVEGKSLRAVVALLAERRIKTTHQAILGFRRRHQLEIDALTQRVVEAVEEVTIKDKAERIRWLAAMAERVRDALDGDGLRYETGVGSRIDASALAQFRGLLADVADELGDRPKTPLIDARTQVLTVEAIDALLAEVGER